MRIRNGLSILVDAMRGARLKFALALAAIMLASFLSLLDPLILRLALDSVLGGRPPEAPAWFKPLLRPLGGLAFLTEGGQMRALGMCALTILGLNLMQGIGLFLKGALAVSASETTAYNIRSRLFSKLSRLPYGYFAKADSGDLIQRCTSDVDTVRRFLESQIVEVGRAVFMVAFAALIMFDLNVRMSLLSMVLVLPIFLWSYLFFLRIQKGFTKTDEAESAMTSMIQENLRGIRVVRAFAREDYELSRFDAKNKAFAGTARRLIEMMGTYWSVSAGMSMLQMALVLCVGGYWAATGSLSPGTFVMFFTYVGRFLWPIRQMGRVLTEFGKTTVALGRLGHILEAKDEYLHDGRIASAVKGRIEFSQVSFEYEAGKPVLDGISFSVEPGEMVAILGRTGAGKSSLLHLIPRFEDVKSGAVLVDGIDVRAYGKEALRGQIAMVLQEPFLFSKTLEENLRLARPGAEREDLEKVAQLACLSGVVSDFEKGWETAVGEEGVTLSGGQRQRAAIARALLRRPRILILDDSLSAVDTETDSLIRAELAKRRGEMSVLVVAHRLTTLAGADRIIVLEKGRIADQGRHEDLCQRPGLYRDIWELQGAEAGKAFADQGKASA